MTPLRPGLHGRSVLRTPDCRAHRLRRARWLRGARHLQGNRIGSQGQPARAQPRLRESRACAAQGENRFPFLSPSPRGQPATCARSGAPTQPQAQPARSKGCCVFPFRLPHFTALPHSPERAACTPAEEAPRCTRREGSPKCVSVHARAPALAPDPREQGRRASASCTAPGRIFAPRGRRPGPFLRRGLSSQACGRRCVGKLRFPYENVRTRDQPDVPRASRRRPCPAVAWACLKTFPYGDSVKSGHTVNRTVALFCIVPLHLRSLQRIGAPQQVRIAGSPENGERHMYQVLDFPTGNPLYETKGISALAEKTRVLLRIA